jgi:hypothetical protein
MKFLLEDVVDNVQIANVQREAAAQAPCPRRVGFINPALVRKNERFSSREPLRGASAARLAT